MDSRIIDLKKSSSAGLAGPSGASGINTGPLLGALLTIAAALLFYGCIAAAWIALV